jgi:ribonuclease-3
MESPSSDREELSASQAFLQRHDLPPLPRALFDRALTHRSYLNEHPNALEDNERLEFLGDAVLDFLVGAWLYQHFPEMKEGELTRMRSALVRTEQLAAFSLETGLAPLMRLGRGESEGGGYSRPSLLCATFEALIGALYLSAGLEAVSRFIEPLLQRATVTILDEHKNLDPKSLFQEWVQGQGLGTPVYRTLSASGPEHEKRYEVEVMVGKQSYGRGFGLSKQAAAKDAAQNALDAQGLS